MRTAHTKLIALALAAGLVSACAARSADIGEVKMNPGRYVDKTVSVEGVVTESWGLPLVPYKLYKVDDGTSVSIELKQGTPLKGTVRWTRVRLNATWREWWIKIVSRAIDHRKEPVLRIDPSNKPGTFVHNGFRYKLPVMHVITEDRHKWLLECERRAQESKATG